MAAQVVTADNLIEYTRTGVVPEFKPPEAVKQSPASQTPADPSPAPPAQARDSKGQFTKPSDGDKTTTAAPSTDKADDGEEGFSEVVRQKINKQHRLRKEAEEFARAEALRALQAERRAEQLERDLQAVRQKSGPAPDATPKEPKPDDFKTVAEYTDALVTYRVDQRERERERQRQHEAEEQAKAERQREFGKRMADARVKHDDFDDVLKSIAGTDLERVHNDVVEYMQESEQGPNLLYHLAKNPDVLDRLRKLSPRRFIAELGKLEAKWESSATPEPPAPKLSEIATTTPVSKAPAPIAPLDTAGIAPVPKKPEDMNVSELREFRRNQDRAKRAQGR